MIDQNATNCPPPVEARPHFPALDSPTFVPLRYRPANLRTWLGHLPFARDLIVSLRPSLLVELGTHYGESYFGFCQSVQETNLSCTCYALDTWRGDPQAGEYGEEVYEDVERYNRERYRAFSYLLRTTFDDALPRFSDESIDLLHIDGLHTYGAITHDCKEWFAKVAPGGILLLHDIAVRHADFGVWKVWEELSKEYESFDFQHSYGLGVIRKPGARRVYGGILDCLFDATDEEQIRRYYVLCAERLEAKADLAAVNQYGNASTFQAYYPQAGVYSEPASLCTPLTAGGWRRLTFDLPHGIDGSGLRLDPADRPALVDIGSVALFHAFDRKELWRCRPQGEDRVNFVVAGTAWGVPLDRYLQVFSYGADPQVQVLIPATVPRGEPLILECWVRLHEDFSQFAMQAQSWMENSQAKAQAEVLPVPSGPTETAVDAITDQIIPALSGREFIALELQHSNQPRNDCTPVEGDPNTWSAATQDPWMVCPVDIDAGSVQFFVLIISCICEAAPEGQLFWTSSERPGFDEGRSLRFRLSADQKAHIYVLDPHASGVWSDSGQLDSIRLDPIDSPGKFTISLAGFAYRDLHITDCVSETSHSIDYPARG